MPEYRVVWEIDVEAESPDEAARLALQCVSDRTSIAHVFEVYDAYGNAHRVDLDGLEGDRCPTVAESR
ncbi:MAG: hypothetical protein ACPLRW_06600 [Moorellales bacterium]